MVPGARPLTDVVGRPSFSSLFPPSFHCQKTRMEEADSLLDTILYSILPRNTQYAMRNEWEGSRTLTKKGGRGRGVGEGGRELYF